MPRKEFELEGFTAVEARNAMQVEISRGTGYSVAVEADDEIIREIEVIVSGGVLKAKFRTRLGHIGLLFKQVASPKLKITMPELAAIKFTAATRGKVTGFSSVDSFTAELSGAGKLTGDMDCRHLKLVGGAASFFELAGRTDTLDLSLTATSHASLEQLKVADARITLGGASTVTLDISGRLDAEVTGASSLRWTGTPSMGDIKVTGASSLSRK
jgi:hypothetical protein